MIKIEIKPLSVNKAWKGKRFKTDIYKSYEKELLYKLPKLIVPKTNISLLIEVGYSNKQADLDNAAKPFIDILQKKYNFNDSQIYELHLKKHIVKKGCDFISFEIR